MYMILFVLDSPNKLDKVLDAWEKIGIRGATIIESTGTRRRQIQQKSRVPGMRYSFIPLDVGGEKGNFTLLTIVPDKEKISECIQATENIVGDLNDPNTGILAAWPLEYIKGVPMMNNSSNAEQGENK